MQKVKKCVHFSTERPCFVFDVLLLIARLSAYYLHFKVSMFSINFQYGIASGFVQFHSVGALAEGPKLAHRVWKWPIKVQ